MGNSVLTAVGMVEIAFWEMTSVNPLSFISEYRIYIGLGSLRTNANLSQGFVYGSRVLQQRKGSIVQILIIICVGVGSFL